MVIEVSALQKSYGDVRALRGLNLAVARGGIIGLLGPNGAGKTTFVEILEGLRASDSGTVRVLGLDPQKQSRELRERIGVQLQQTEFPEGLTVDETLRLFGALYPRHQSPEAALASVDLSEKRRALVRGLSGGQKQRLALAIATLHEPELLILDEPTSGLDPIARRGIHDILRRLKAEGRTILVSSHYLDEIEALADRVLILRAGELVADGTPLELLNRAAGESTLWLHIEGAAEPETLITGARFTGRDGALLRYSAPDPTAAIVSLGERLRETGARLLDLRLKRPTLEDLYVQLIGQAASEDASNVDRATEAA